MGWVVNARPKPFYPRERPGTHCIWGWVGPRAGLDRCGKSRPHWHSIPGPSSSYRVAIPTELSRSTTLWSTYPKHWGLNRFRDVCRPSSRGRMTDDDGDGTADWRTVTSHTPSHFYSITHSSIAVFQLLLSTTHTQQRCARHCSFYLQKKYITSPNI